MEQIFAIIVSILLIIFIVWWFMGKGDTDTRLAIEHDGVQTIEILVDGGYQPRAVELKAGVPAKLIFNRKDPSSCLEEVLLPDFGVSKMLALGEKTEIEIDPNKPGEYRYTCGMQMFSGKVVVK
jgi:plastocyanin domain-containing protein